MAPAARTVPRRIWRRGERKGRGTVRRASFDCKSGRLPAAVRGAAALAGGVAAAPRGTVALLGDREGRAGLRVADCPVGGEAGVRHLHLSGAGSDRESGVAEALRRAARLVRLLFGVARFDVGDEVAY